ncbi:MAG TPA: HlyD family efflux transporter periplasmic adaptor subunit [Terriglobales bacterium]|nr:HlyD family efflux transporter periplasmic adaptor subunit [Terriglobales bacterium]
MNLNEVFNVALPDVSTAARRKAYPRIHPNIVWRERVEEGEPTILCIVPGVENVFPFTPQQWDLVQLCDGERSYEEVSEAYLAQSGSLYEAAQIQQFAEQLDGMGFWYKSPQQRILAASERLATERRKHSTRKSKVGDLSEIVVAYWDPDKYLAWVHTKVWWIYTTWFTLLTLVAFAIVGYFFFTHWGEIWRDTLRYYDFSDKSGYDLAEFWILFCLLAAVHETAHGLTCKHFGGEVHRMGFLLIFLSPAFFVDASEVYVYGGKWQRVATFIAGIWVELILFAVALLVWSGTPQGSWVHDFLYKIMLISGIGVVVLNLNPLMKLDGYYIFSELVGMLYVKERSTAFVTGYIKKNIFHLPVEVEYVPPRQRLLLVPYCLLSGLYSYAVLAFLAKFTYNIFKHYTHEWAFVPALFVAYLLFRSRLRSLVRFMNTIYLDKKEKLRAWLTSPRLAALGALVLLLCVPIWRDTVDARCVLEPSSRAYVRALVPGTVEQVYADEGQPVSVGAPLAKLQNLKLESEAAQAEAELRTASSRATSEQLRYGSFGAAERERHRWAERSRQLSDELLQLQLRAPISGVVLTPRIRDRVGSTVAAGAIVAEVADLSTMLARIYVPEFDMNKLRVGAPARLRPASSFATLPATVLAIAPASSQIPDGLLDKSHYQGMRPPQFYVATVLVLNPSGLLRDGVSGNVKIWVGRRSIAGFGWREVREFVGRKIW